MVDEAKSMEAGSGSTPDAIQPHGWMIVCDNRAVTVRRHSANLGDLFPGGPKTFLGANLRDIIGSEASHALRNALSRFAGPARPALLPGLSLKGCDGAFDCAVYAADDETIVEIERAAPGDPRAIFDRARAMIERVAVLQELDKLLQASARLIGSLLLYERVVVLQIAPDGSMRSIVDPKGREKPAPPAKVMTLPAETRRLYRDGRIRFIVDAGAEPAALLSLPELDRPDLGFAHLVAPSPDESERLRRDGRVASLSLAIIVDGELWGLIQCNDHAPKNPGMDLRAVAELFCNFLSLQVEILLQREELKELRSLRGDAAQGFCAQDAGPRSPLRVMIVEDQPLIAMDLEAELMENGAEVACLATSAAQALAALDRVAIDAAVLDFDLDGETSDGVAAELELRGIPFVFATGHGDANGAPARFAGHAVTHKPYDALKILAALNEAVAKGLQNERGEIPHT